MFFVYLIVALAAGVALATQSAINTQLAKAMSGEAVIATFISFAVGTIFLFLSHWLKLIYGATYPQFHHNLGGN